MATPPSSYREYEKEASELVRRVLQSSQERLKRENAERPAHQWPASDEFTADKGLEAVSGFVEHWEIGESWKYCTSYLGQQDNRLHGYQVQWSEPTRRRPVPTATASVYFYLLPQENQLPVAVFYVVEGQRLVHRPSESVFREAWLRNVIQDKLAIAQSLSL